MSNLAMGEDFAWFETCSFRILFPNTNPCGIVKNHHSPTSPIYSNQRFCPCPPYVHPPLPCVTKLYLTIKACYTIEGDTIVIYFMKRALWC